MVSLKLRAPHHFERGFSAIRAELDVPQHFPDDVLDAAFGTIPLEGTRRDATDLELLAIDPPGATDLDQAYFAQRRGDGYRVSYAIADVGPFVPPGGLVDAEARRRGTTLYSPDLRTPLHPTIISEDRASLLAGSDRPALLWTIDLDASGEVQDHHLERATVRVREAISYAEAQQRIDGGADGDPRQTSLQLLAEIGRHRERIEAERGGISLNLPSQEVTEQDGTYHLRYDRALPVENWNAQISLLTGMTAGRVMYDAKVGLLRTLPTADPRDLNRLRMQATTLGINWPHDVDYPDMVRSVDPDSAASSAFLLQCARTFRGAGYEAMLGTQPEHPRHGAIAAIYAHVTAPLRRLVDRFANEILVALYAGAEPPAFATEALEELPMLMGKARSRERDLERAIVAYTEATILEPNIGQHFDAGVVDYDDRRDRFSIQLNDPAVTAHLSSDGVAVGDEIRVRLTEANPTDRQIAFELAP